MFRRLSLTTACGLLIPLWLLAETIIPGGSVSGEWNSSGSPYIITGDIWIDDGNSLLILSSVEVRFDLAVGLTVYGDLDATGTGGSVIFTSNLPNPQMGDWDGIVLTGGGTCDFDYCTVNYADLDGDEPYNYGSGFNLNNSTVCNIGNTMRSTTIVSCVVNGSIDAYPGNSGYGYLEVSNCEIYGNLNCTGYDSEFIATGNTIYGSVNAVVGYMGMSYSIQNNELYDGGINVIRNSDEAGGSITGNIISNAEIGISLHHYDGGFSWAGTGTITNNIIDGATSCGIVYSNSDPDDYDANISGNQVSNTASSAIKIIGNIEGGTQWGLSSATIERNRISSCGGYGIYTKYFQDVEITNNTIEGVDSTGIYITDETLYYTSSATVKNNIISSGVEFGLHISDMDDAVATFNDVWTFALGNYSGVTPGSGSISLDPQFVDPENGNLNLQRVSPCIDAGDPTSPLDPDDTRTDMGALYFHQDMPVKLTLIPEDPPIVLPETGGEFGFNIEVTNRTEEVQTFDFWSEIELPGWGSVEIMSITGLSIAVEDTVNRDRTQAVPDFAPPGIYTYLAYVGTYPWIVEDYYYFHFEKEGTDLEGSLGAAADWPCFGNVFDSELNAVEIPADFALSAPYPNPFNPSITISFTLPEPGWANLAVYNSKGQQVMQLIDGYRDAGCHNITIGAYRLASGIYFCRLDVGDFTATRKMILMK